MPGLGASLGAEAVMAGEITGNSKVVEALGQSSGARESGGAAVVPLERR